MSKRRIQALLFQLLPCLLLFPSLFWITEDHTVWPWDQAWYGEVSVDLWFWLGHSVRRWAGEMADGLNLKPPGVVWLGQLFLPLHHVLGSIEASLLFSIVVAQFILLAILLQIGRRIQSSSPLAAVAGVTLAAGSSLFVGLSHQFFVEPLQAAAVAWVFYVAIEFPRWPAPRIVIHLAIAMIVGILAKASTPLYCLLPCCYAVLQLRRSKSPWREFRACWKSPWFRAQTLLAVLLAAVAACWYGRHLGDVWQHVHDASNSDVALHYGSRDTWVHKMVFWSNLAWDSFLAPYICWIGIALIVGAALFIWRKRYDRPLGIETVSVLALLQIVAVLSVFSTTVTGEPRFLYPILPALAIVFMQICAFIPARLLGIVIVASAVQWGVVNAESFSLIKRLPHQSQWLLPLNSDGTRYDELARVVSLTSDVQERYDIVALEDPSVNANAAAFFAAKNRLQTGMRCYYTSLGYGETDVSKAMQRIRDFRTRYVITLAEPLQPDPPDFLNVVSLPILRQMRTDHQFVRVPFSSRTGILVFQYQDTVPEGTGTGSPH